MNKLLTISILLLSLNLYGADKPKTEFDKEGNLVTDIDKTPREIALEKENKELKAKVADLTKKLDGADKPRFLSDKIIYSPRSLEGWGKTAGVRIGVPDYLYKDKTFDKKGIVNLVELKLRQAGIKYTDQASLQFKPTRPFDDILINCQPIHAENKLIGYAIDIRSSRTMIFKYDGQAYQCFSGTIRVYGGISSPNYRKVLGREMDRFLSDWLKANPKK